MTEGLNDQKRNDSVRLSGVNTPKDRSLTAQLYVDPAVVDGVYRYGLSRVV